MESFIVKFGNAITGALGISNEAVGIIMIIGLVWFYKFRWIPFSKELANHVKSEDDANGTYKQRAEERDRLALKLQESLDKIDTLLDAQGSNIEKVDRTLESTDKERSKMIADIDSIKMELIKISVQLSMSPNARSLK